MTDTMTGPSQPKHLWKAKLFWMPVIFTFHCVVCVGDGLHASWALELIDIALSKRLFSKTCGLF